MERPADYDHLLCHAQRLFPGAKIAITYTDDEIIQMDVDDRRFSFEIGSDDDGYIFDDGMTSFFIPLFSDDPQDYDLTNPWNAS